MKAYWLVPALVGGVAAGAAVVMILAPPRPTKDQPPIELANIAPVASEFSGHDLTTDTTLTAPQLADALFGRVTSRIVAVSKQYEPDSIEFYIQPRSYGDYLCEIDGILFPQIVLRGSNHRFIDNGPWHDEISKNEYYAIWRIPGERTNETPDQACARFRQFGRLIDTGTSEGAGSDVDGLERVVEALPIAIAEARSGKMSFVLKCVDERESELGKAKRCDGRDLLAALDLRTIYQVRSRSASGDDQRHVDEVFAQLGRVGHSRCNQDSGEVDEIDLTSAGRRVDGTPYALEPHPDESRNGQWREVPTEVDINLSTVC